MIDPPVTTMLGTSLNFSCGGMKGGIARQQLAQNHLISKCSTVS
jgi:hypothetical protein